MSWSHIQGTGSQNSGSSTQTLSCAYATNVTAGNLLVCGFVGYQPVGATVSDNQNAGTWSQAAVYQYGTTGWVGLYYIINTYTGPLTVTASSTSGLNYPSMSIDEYSFSGGSYVSLDGTKSAGGTGKTAATAAIAPTNSDLVYAACIVNGTATATPTGNARYSQGIVSGKAYGICAQDWLNQSGSVTPSVGFSASVGWDIVAIAFRASSTPPVVIGQSYVACSGQTLVFFPTLSANGNTAYPTAINVMPSVSVNGGTAVQCSLAWCPPDGSSPCCLIAIPIPLPNGNNQVNPGDVVSVTAPTGWLTTTGGTTGSLSIASMTNAVNALPPSLPSITKTFKPGFNLCSSMLPYGRTILLRNLRIRTQFSGGLGGGVSAWDAGGNPTTLSSATAFGTPLNFNSTASLPGNNTQEPGVPGFYGIIWDDNAYGSSNQCNMSLVTFNGSQSTVTHQTTFDNSGSGGIGQAGVYRVAPAAGSTVANVPVSIWWSMPGSGRSPRVSNLFVIGPRDLVTRYSSSITVTNGSTAITFANTQSGLTGQWLWVEGDPTVGLYQFASGSGTSWTLSSAFQGNSGTFANLYWGTLPNGPIQIDRSQPYALSRYYTDLFPNGHGVLRWMDAACGFAAGAQTQMTQSWETRQLTDFSYTYSGGRTNTVVTPTTAQPLTTANSPYIYGDNLGSPWTSAATIGTVMSSVPQGDMTPGNLVLSSATAATDPIMYGLVLGINVGQPNQEWVRVVKVNADNQTLTVQRAACVYSLLTTSPQSASALPPATAPAHSVGEPITIYSRIAWGSLSTFGGSSGQVAEFVSSNNHNLISGMPLVNCVSGNLTGVLDSNGNQFSYTWQFSLWATAPNRFVMFGLGGGSNAICTLGSTYTLTGGFTIKFQNPPPAYPWEIPGLTGQAMGCNLHFNIPQAASDGLIYDMAVRALNNSQVGTIKYVEYMDEPWNEGAGNGSQYTLVMNGRIRNTPYGDGATWYTLRAAQIGNIWRSVFATANRQSEVCMMLNINNGGYTYVNSANPSNNGGIPCIFGALTCNTYSGGDSQPNSAGYSAYYVNSLLPQSGSNNPDYIGAIADYSVHTLAFLTGSNAAGINRQVPLYTSLAPTMNSIIQAYNTANGTSYPNVVLYGYEGDVDTWAPKNLPANGDNAGSDGQGLPYAVYTTNHDCFYDPTMYWYQQVAYLLTQQGGWADVAAYSLDLGFNYAAAWTYFECPAQWPGRGDGSDGLANNRLCRVTPGLQYKIPNTVNQAGNTVNPRILAHQTWMQQVQGQGAGGTALAVPSQRLNRSVTGNRYRVLPWLFVPPSISPPPIAPPPLIPPLVIPQVLSSELLISGNVDPFFIDPEQTVRITTGLLP